MPLLLLILLSSLAYADPLLDSILGYRYVPREEFETYQTEIQETYTPDEYGNSETGEGPFFYSWDDIYLCQYCETEIIYEDVGDTLDTYSY